MEKNLRVVVMMESVKAPYRRINRKMNNWPTALAND
jgi:hypothetical protein